MNLATLNKVYQALRLVPFLIMFIGIGLLATRILEPDFTFVSILIASFIILQFAMTIIKFILSRAGISTARTKRNASTGSVTPDASTGINPGFGSSTSFTSSAVFGASPETADHEAPSTPSPVQSQTESSSVLSASAIASYADATSMNVPDPTQTYVPQDVVLMFIEDVFAISGVGTVVSGTLLRPLNDGDRVVLKTTKGSVRETQVTTLQVWRDGELQPTGRAIMEDAVSFRLENIDSGSVAAGDKICAIG